VKVINSYLTSSISSITGASIKLLPHITGQGTPSFILPRRRGRKDISDGQENENPIVQPWLHLPIRRKTSSLPFPIPCCLLPRAFCLYSLHHLIRSREYLRRNHQTNLFRCFKVNDEFKLCRLLHRQISRLGTFQDLVHVNSRAPKEVSVVHSIGHQAALIDKLLLVVNSRQPVSDGKLDDPLSLGGKRGLLVGIIAPTCFCFAV
jgi:hypothetical protein